MNEVYNLSDGKITKLRREEHPTIDGVENIKSLEKKDIELYLENDNVFSVKGFTIKKLEFINI